MTLREAEGSGLQQLRTVGWLGGDRMADAELRSMLGTPAGPGGTVTAAVFADGWLILDLELSSEQDVSQKRTDPETGQLPEQDERSRA
jgi:hypothetical protein